MYLSKLEIFGFKSFANKTAINFTKGITGIVGPNGCGKTNIVDAIRWVLGEQKSSTLRSDKMENVIFNGTKHRKPMGMSEVSLTLMNDKGILPTDYSEVTITRRIFRSGESEYLLNRNLCRLKDITNLFMDTGMGSNAYSVIELKMIETILSSKAEERRRLFEEAAGVNKYKLRRRLSLKKLDDVKSDLTRVNDIVSEVDKTVRSLERQAKKADKYNQIQTVLREKEIDLAEREFFSFHKENSQLAENKSHLTSRKNEIDTDIRTIENELILFRDQIGDVDSALTEKRSELSENTNLLHELQKTISVSEERIKSLERNLDKYTQEIEELKYQKEENQELISSNRISIEEYNSKLTGKDKEIGEKQSGIGVQKTFLEDKKELLKAKNEESLNKFKQLSEKENELKNLKSSHARTNNSIEALNHKIQKTTTSIAKSVGYLEELENEKLEVQKKLEDSESTYLEKQKEKENLEKTISRLKGKELEAKSSLNELKNKIDFLQTLITNLEGVSKASKQLIESEGWTDKEKTLFADVGNTEEKFRFALEASLKNVLNNLLLERYDDLEKAIDYLKKNDLGKASFFILQLNDSEKKSFIQKLYEYSLKRKQKKIQNESEFLNWAYELVETSENWKPYFEKILCKTVITENLETAILLHRKYSDFSFATLDGDFVNKDGIVEAGSSPKLDETLFGRKQLVENLKNEIPKHEEKIKSIQNEVVERESDLNKIDLKELSERGKILMNEVNSIDKQISQLEFEVKKSNEEIDKAQHEINSLASESNQLDQKIDLLDNEITAGINLRDESNNELRKLENEVKIFEEEYNTNLDEFNKSRVELERLKGQLENLHNSLERANKSEETIIATLSKRESDINSANEEISTIKVIIEEKQIDYDDLYETRSRLESEASEIQTRLKSLKDEASGYEKKLQSIRNERQNISDSVHEIDIRLNEIKLRLENLVNHIKDEYSLDLELKEYDDLETFDFKERSREVHGLKDNLKNLGPINLLAYSEYEEEKERLDFLLKQRDDLIESEKDIINTIKEINNTAQNLFIETFNEIRENFRKIFQTLFNPGDEADLILEENVDPLEAKIEIIAKPKGKRPTGIELLSGGEKTLTATALLFAIYLVKPSPFCILDEVDAPLDDANVDRFTKLLKEFSFNTQFIIVTHNKRTMEAAENMYGVTIQEEGVSKLAAVQFNEDLPVQ